MGPYLFDTSAQGWLQRSTDPAVWTWLASYLEQHPFCVSAITVMERARGYALRLQEAPPTQRSNIVAQRQTYLDTPREVRPVDSSVAYLAGELAAMLPQPPTPMKRSHRISESRQDRLFRWRCDILIAATALVARMPLVHHNPQDFETIRMAIETAPERFPTLGPLNLVNVIRLAQA